MKIYIVYKSECIYDSLFDKAFLKLEDAKKYVDKDLNGYATYLKKATLPEIYEAAIEETELLGVGKMRYGILKLIVICSRLIIGCENDLGKDLQKEKEFIEKLKKELMQKND